MKGTKTSSGKITISNGNAEISERITVGTFDVVYNPTTKSYEATEKGNSSSEDDKPTTPGTPKTPTVVYRWSTDEINIGDTVNDSTKYTTDSSTLERNYYLKHADDTDGGCHVDIDGISYCENQ